MFNRDLKITQTGTTIARIIPKAESGDCLLTDILEAVSILLKNGQRITDPSLEAFAFCIQ